jgi:cytosine/adenosine deaminase-related metal-dependent hydrolase
MDAAPEVIRAEIDRHGMKSGHRPVEHLHQLGVMGTNVVVVHMVHVADREILDRCAELGEQMLARSKLVVPGKWPIY